MHALGADAFAFAGTTRVNAGGAPAFAAVLSAAPAIAFIVTGTFDSVLAVLAFLFVGAYVVSLSAVFRLRRSEPGLERPYRAWGFPVTTGLALAGSVAFLIGALVTDLRNSVIALGLVALSYVVYRYLGRGR
jgi:APA family basic amino acid/polyamine antiporter